MKSHITYDTSNVIYMIQCVKCKLQYIGETKRRLKDRLGDLLSTPQAILLLRSLNPGWGGYSL